MKDKERDSMRKTGRRRKWACMVRRWGGGALGVAERWSGAIGRGGEHCLISPGLQWGLARFLFCVR